MVASTPVPIYTRQDFYVPYFEVWLDLQRLPRDAVHDIIEVTYKDSLDTIDSFDITINNWDSHKRTFKYLDIPMFDPGKTVMLWMGYYGKQNLRLMTVGTIKSWRPVFPSDGKPTLTISGLNMLDRLRTKQESHYYVKKTDSAIAKEVAKRLKVEIETSGSDEEEYDYILQDNIPDIIFLMQRARRVGYDLFVKESKESGTTSQPGARPSVLYFGPTGRVRDTTYELKYGISLTEFQPNLDTSNQVSKVTVRGWDAKNKKPITHTATRAQIPIRGVGEAGRQKDLERSFADREEVISDRPVNSQQEARTLATETLNRNAKGMLTGTGRIVGLPDLRAGCVLQIEGFGTRFSGRYFVTGTTHTINDGGYTTQFECRREEL
jgi:phage protein D